MMTNLIAKFENNKVFSDAEAWMLFRLAAFGEACGWTLLIIGIGLSRYVFAGSQAPVLVAGRVHGTLFILYAVAAVGLYPALRWSRRRSLVALLASIPPYGSLLFELWVSRVRKNRQFRIYKSCVVMNRLLRDIKPQGVVE